MNIFTYLTPKNNTYYIVDNISVRQAIEKFDFYKFSVVPVIDENGKYINSISEGDLLSFIKNVFLKNSYPPVEAHPISKPMQTCLIKSATTRMSVLVI